MSYLWSWLVLTYMISILIFFNVLFIFERQSTSREGAEREGDTESKAGSRLWVVSTEPNAGLKLTSCEIMTWAEVGRSTGWATQAPPVMSNLEIDAHWLSKSSGYRHISWVAGYQSQLNLKFSVFRHYCTSPVFQNEGWLPLLDTNFIDRVL